MVNKNYIEENTACDISNKINLRRESCEDIDRMGSTHGHLLNEMHKSDVEGVQDILNGLKDGKLVKRYDKETLLALRDEPHSKVKPNCADERPFWVNGKPFRGSSLRKKIDRETRFGSGRLSSGDKYIHPTTNMSSQAPLYNPVNHDHRRLYHEKSDENLPEWVNAGPKTRFETIDLHGFFDDKNSSGESGSGSKYAENRENKEPNKKFGKAFSFDEFLDSQTNGMQYPPQESYSSYNNRPYQGQSQFKRYFNNNKNRDFNFQRPQQQQQQHQNPPPGFVGQQRNNNFHPKFDANNNEAAAALLDLLHRQINIDQYKQQPTFNFGNKNMLTAADLEAFRSQNNRATIERQRQMDQNKAMLAGKSIVDVLDVLTKSQMRTNSQAAFNNKQQYNPQWNQQFQQQQQYNPHNRSGMNAPVSCMKSNNQMNKFQMARVLERQMMVQGPMYGGLTPQDPEYWEKIRQQQENFYQQYERNAATRQVKAKFPGNERHVKFEEKSTLEQFFDNHQNIGDLPSFDPEKAIKVEEFERKIKGAAAFKQYQQ